MRASRAAFLGFEVTLWSCFRSLLTTISPSLLYCFPSLPFPFLISPLLPFSSSLILFLSDPLLHSILPTVFFSSTTCYPSYDYITNLFIVIRCERTTVELPSTENPQTRDTTASHSWRGWRSDGRSRCGWSPLFHTAAIRTGGTAPTAGTTAAGTAKPPKKTARAIARPWCRVG